MEIFFFWLLCSILGATILSSSNHAGTGFLLGAILGPFGVLFALVMSSGKNKDIEQKRHEEQMQSMADLKSDKENKKQERECPYCAETVLQKAKICKHCGSELPPVKEIVNDTLPDEQPEQVVIKQPRQVHNPATGRMEWDRGQ
jgi:uncharacterized protein with PIN domain